MTERAAAAASFCSQPVFVAVTRREHPPSLPLPGGFDSAWEANESWAVTSCAAVQPVLNSIYFFASYFQAVNKCRTGFRGDFTFLSTCVCSHKRGKPLQCSTAALCKVIRSTMTSDREITAGPALD